MTSEDIIALLQNIKLNKYAGTAGVEVISHCIDEGLIERTELGNFKLSLKGEYMLFEGSKGKRIIK
jgi:hypothetical protein